MSPSTWAIVVFSALLPLAVAFRLWLEAVRTLGVAQATSFGFLVPVLAGIASAIFTGERFNAPKILSAAVVLSRSRPHPGRADPGNDRPSALGLRGVSGGSDVPFHRPRRRSHRSRAQPAQRRVSLDEARARVASGDAAAVSALDGSYALVGVDGITVRLARSLDRPLRYFLAKETEGPCLVVADRIDAAARLAERARARRPVPPELHAHGAGAPRRHAAPRGLSRPGSDVRPDLHAGAERPAGGSRRDRAPLRRGARRRDRDVGRVDSRRRADRRRLLGRHRQRRRLPRHASRPPPPRPQPRAPQGLHALGRGRPGPRAGPPLPRRAGPRLLPRGTSTSIPRP